MTEQVQGEGLVLRPFSPSDLPTVIEAFEDLEIVRWNPGPPADEDSALAAADWMKHRNDRSDTSHRSWAVGGVGGELFGSLSLHKIDPVQADAEIGYWLAPAARGRGRAAVAVRLATRYAFAELGLHRVHLLHAVENVASCRVASAAGFSWEGTLRQSYRYPDGDYHDEHLHGRLVSDPD